MKQIITKYFMALGLALTLTTSCTDLDYENYTYIDSDNFPQSNEDLYSSLIGVYNTLGNSYIYQWLNNSGFIAQELSTDELNT